MGFFNFQVVYGILNVSMSPFVNTNKITKRKNDEDKNQNAIPNILFGLFINV